MKVITEQKLRETFRNSVPQVYYVPEDTLLSPAAREYLNQKKVKISQGEEIKEEPKLTEEKVWRYEDYETGAHYEIKPEYMTEITPFKLVYKNHPRIVLRGKLDHLQALIVLTQAEIYRKDSENKIVEVLEEVLNEVRQIVKCEVLEELLEPMCIMKLSDEEIRERSHHPEKFFKVKQMTLPHYTMGMTYVRLNEIRTVIREVEAFAVTALDVKRDLWAKRIILSLNRLSSVMHILMCITLDKHPKRDVKNGY